MTTWTTDTFFNGRVKVQQEKNGYRFAVDSVLIAWHARPRRGNRVLDLGTGCGIISLILAYRHKDIHIHAIEIQRELAELALRNVAANNLKNRITILCQDMKQLNPPMIGGPADWVICNPPYRQPQSGRLNPDPQKAAARHEILATLEDVVVTASRMLMPSGHFITIYPAERITDILLQMRSKGIEPKYLRSIHPRQNAEAKLILVEGVQSGRPGIKIGPPLVIYRNGDYTAEVERMFQP
jgi:tRNA1Val (adenine37-N6)-methyltransferase